MIGSARPDPHAAAGARVKGVEAGRGIAALLVLCFHVRDHLFKGYGLVTLGDLFRFGHAGVDFFFVLSGFIILHVHAADIGRPDRLGNYVRRRFTRIFPFYWVVLAMSLCAIALSPHGVTPVWSSFPMSVLLLPSAQEPIVSVAWTLQHELLFYTVFGVLIVNRSLGLAVFASWLLVVLAVGAAPDADVSPVLKPFNLHFALGMAAAWLLARRLVPWPLGVLTVGAALFLAVGALEDASMLDGHGRLTDLGYGLGSMLAILGVVEAEYRGLLAVPRGLVALGGASYAIYLTHILAIGAIWQIMLRTRLAALVPLWVSFAVLAIGAMAVGWIVSHIVERPLVQHLRSILDRRTANEHVVLMDTSGPL